MADLTYEFDAISLRQYVAPNNQAAVYVRGTVTAADGLGSMYCWDPGSVAADDALDVIKVNNVLTGRWLREVSSAGGATKVILGGDQVNSTDVAADVTGLSFAVAANTTYLFRFTLIFQSAATGTGIELAMNGPASPTSVNTNILIHQSANDWRNNSVSGYDSFFAGLAVSAANNGKPATLEGTLVNGANAGVLIVRFKSETDTVAVTVKGNSSGLLWTA